MKSSFFLSILTGLTSAATVEPINSILNSLTTVPTGVLQLGSDGVIRSYGPDLKTVLDFAPLDPAQISELVTMARSNSIIADRIPDFKGVNGHDVPIKELAEPPAAITDALVAAANLDYPLDSTPVVNPLVEKRNDCGNVLCKNISVCKNSGCVFCFFFVPGIGACV
ncbi:hypothetical protein QBC38DRAFT_481595 [Podospora fimiseda]|uniref:Uncharacterized protein n=1 Tax=Podospora fimiseda TaxID=252190 RepID=A0AAN7GW09_9PEZI|nr:hypothetical protein QBC38DRAFT_481595 [Podospora fimiseda]